MAKRNANRRRLTGKRATSRRAAGFTLLEILVAVLFVAISISAVTSLFQRGFESQAHSSNLTQATLLARGVVERFQALSYPKALREILESAEYQPFIEGGRAAGKFHWRANITTTPAGFEVVNYRVQVAWPARHIRHTLTFPAALAKR